MYFWSWLIQLNRSYKYNENENMPLGVVYTGKRKIYWQTKFGQCPKEFFFLTWGAPLGWGRIIQKDCVQMFFVKRSGTAGLPGQRRYEELALCILMLVFHILLAPSAALVFILVWNIHTCMYIYMPTPTFPNVSNPACLYIYIYLIYISLSLFTLIQSSTWWQELCERANGIHWKVWTQTKILSRT